MIHSRPSWCRTRQFSLLGFFVLALLFLWPSTPTAQTLTVVQTTTDKKFVPQGNKIAMIYIKLQANNGDMTFTSIDFRNNASQVFFGKHVTRALLYKDNPNSQQTVFDDGQETELARINFTLPSTADHRFGSFSETLPSGNTQGYFVVYEISDTAPLSATTNLQLLDIGQSSFNFGSNTITNTATVTGFAAKNITSIAPSVLIPGQSKIGMLKLQLKMQGEEVDNGFHLRLANQGNNFVGSTSDKTGITAVYLYKPVIDTTDTFDPNFINNYTLAKSIIAGNFTSPSEITFSFTGAGSFTLPDGVTKNFFVVYDIGEEIQVTTETKVYAQITELSGRGKDSRVSINLGVAAPQPPAESLVAGLSYSNALNIVPANINFGKQSSVPMLSFRIQANHATINARSVSIRNPGNVPFITNPTNLENVQKITLYEDTNRDGLFNGIDSSFDTKIGDLKLGTGTNQQERAVITLAVPNTGDLIISPFNKAADTAIGYNKNNAKQIFILYHQGNAIQPIPTISTANALPHSIAQLENVVGSTNIGNSNYVLNLSGAKPVSANPEAIVFYKDVNLTVTDITDISPTFSVLGQSKVPMLAFGIDSQETIASASMLIKNIGDTFSALNQGVSKVWLYKDQGSTGVFQEGTDVLITNVIPQNSQTLSFANVPLSSGENNFLLLYDIGFSPIPSSKSSIARASFSAVSGSGGASIFGNNIQQTEANINISAQPLSINNIVLTTNSTGSYLTNSFNVTILVENTSTKDVTLLEIQPRIYQSSNIGGKNITYEFSSFFAGSTGNIPANTTATYNFELRHNNPITEGVARIDAYAQYTVDIDSQQTGTGLLTRYLTSNGWVGAFDGNNPQITLQSSGSQYTWTWPAYVSKTEIESNSLRTPFRNNDAIPESSVFYITLYDNGQNIDPNSIRIRLRGTTVPKQVQAVGGTPATSYTYNEQTGVIRIEGLGSSSGQIRLNVNDNDGNTLPESLFDFQIRTSARLSETLFYPNPYTRGDTPLRLGFNLTQPATVSLYIYNHLGVQVFTRTDTFNTIGYNSMLIDGNTDFVTSGMYVCRIFAIDKNGNKSSAQTRLAVY